jgi:hypothetical protein
MREIIQVVSDDLLRRPRQPGLAAAYEIDHHENRDDAAEAQDEQAQEGAQHVSDVEFHARAPGPARLRQTSRNSFCGKLTLFR